MRSVFVISAAYAHSNNATHDPISWTNWNFELSINLALIFIGILYVVGHYRLKQQNI